MFCFKYLRVLLLSNGSITGSQINRAWRSITIEHLNTTVYRGGWIITRGSVIKWLFKCVVGEFDKAGMRERELWANIQSSSSQKLHTPKVHRYFIASFIFIILVSLLLLLLSGYLVIIAIMSVLRGSRVIIVITCMSVLMRGSRFIIVILSVLMCGSRVIIVIMSLLMRGYLIIIIVIMLVLLTLLFWWRFSWLRHTPSGFRPRPGNSRGW